MVSFLQRKATPARAELVEAVHAVRALITAWRRRHIKVDVVHVPRELNKLADWAATTALRFQAHFQVGDLAPGLREHMEPPDTTPADVDRLCAMMHTEDEPANEPVCRVCSREVPEEEMVRCWGCPGVWHRCC